MSNELATIEAAIEDIAAGKMVIMVDDIDRENEGDLVMAAECVSPDAINFMITHARGLVCMPMLDDDFMRLRIPMMVKNNNAPRQTAFGVSIEARDGVTTGISPADRAQTILAAVDPGNGPESLVSPGHIFPLLAKKGGVLARNGHTEGSVDLARLAGFRSAAVICEIINDDGTMARIPDLTKFALKHDLRIISIRDLQTYRIQHEKLVELTAQAQLPVHEHGQFQIKTFTSAIDQQEYVALMRAPVDSSKAPLVRLHSACMTGDVFGSARCDCGEQLHLSLAQVAHEGGIVLYLPQEGRGIGLSNKIKAYALQEQGLDTVEANQRLGFAADLRDYGLAAQVLRELGYSQVRLLTNNPKKVSGLQRYGINVVERIALETQPLDANVRYLQTKREKMGHWLVDSQV